MKIGEPRYQPTGNVTASAATTRTAVRRGCRAAAANQPSLRATATIAASVRPAAMATGMRNS
jgi:hypothetical protein